ncbi:heme ABC exporter ATP-binding protein CcmA [Thalassobaculum sp. OXR-137]|uniref:heme ABC exporter ATP-binding protein CcmA n=1 Tax=Thalassobaculum sp. OXR-137 TaxID=3100173 RepID=UPI002AC9B253|nr:heme ABC exporter ATP-binding protein CcmA [Thalassobaculum sp. OXR-137]WPZ36025.1 heme ABC exporter ATP-binding protein CcmA [Thalassobaculum sp. OXR-137]
MADFSTAPAPLTASELAVIRGGRPVFAGLSLALDVGGALRLAGPNGGGKSTVLRVVAGLLAPLRGRVNWNGAPIGDDPAAHGRRIAYLGHADALKSALTARENAETLLAVAGRRSQETLDRAFALLDLERLADLPAGWLSAGQRRRVALARVVASGAPLWLLDEPTVGLDAASVAALERAIAGHRSAGGMVIAATHIALDLGPGDATLDPGAFAWRPDAFDEMSQEGLV